MRLVAHLLLVVYFKKLLAHDTVEIYQKIQHINFDQSNQEVW